MNCPNCGMYAPACSTPTANGGGAPRYLAHLTRHRLCTHCGERWTTVEVDVEAFALLLGRAGEMPTVVAA